ncbi:hypothetical protein [Stutzerimonas stutzeri]|uniref:hypothetical protein n=1 Tax=Stutzerimonas stutzeri TaxID=316 RepID=UPI00210E2CD9|nr:hypothetical protein [Stutzerimonas stutzeri]MCQ4257440.1 hypothetical protein [Stutzerimonas stutzeri]
MIYRELVSRRIAIGVLWMGAVVLLLIVLPFSWNAALSSWVQAIGTIMAVLFAADIARSQHEAQVAAQETERLLADSVYRTRFVFSCTELIHLIDRLTKEPAPVQAKKQDRYRFMLDEFLRRIGDAHLNDLHTGRLGHLQTLRMEVMAIFDVLDDPYALGTFSPAKLRDIRARVSAVQAAAAS